MEDSGAVLVAKAALDAIFLKRNRESVNEMEEEGECVREEGEVSPTRCINCVCIFGTEALFTGTMGSCTCRSAFLCASLWNGQGMQGGSSAMGGCGGRGLDNSCPPLSIEDGQDDTRVDCEAQAPTWTALGTMGTSTFAGGIVLTRGRVNVSRTGGRVRVLSLRPRRW